MNRIALLLLVAACSKKDDAPPPSTTKKAEPPPAMSDKKDDMPEAFKAWDLDARAKAWQGAWVLDHGGPPIAVDIKGDQVTAWDGKADKKLSFKLESPCGATFTEHKPDGSSEGVTSTFTIKDGKLVTGLGDAGSRKGKTAVACVGGKVLTLDDAGKCLAWDGFMGWKSSPAECAIAQKDGKDVFTAKVNGYESTLLIDGDAMMSDQLAHKSAASFPDFAAAKAARDKG